MRVSAWLIVMVVLASAGCGDGDGDGLSGSTTTDPAPSKAVGVVSYHYTGGISGETATITVAGDGAATRDEEGFRPPPRQSSVMVADDLEQLHQIVGGRAYIDTAKATSPHEPGQCCDLVFVTITADIDGETVVAYSGGDAETPDEFRRVIDLFRAIDFG